MSHDFSFVWFTYKYDAPLILRSVKAITSLFPESPKFVYDDAAENPLPKRVIEALKRMGCTVIGTKFPRKGNLRGWDCASIMAALYRSVQLATGCKVLVKLDSDTLVLSDAPMKAFLKSDKVYAGLQSRCKRSIWGPLYMLKLPAIDALTESYRYDMKSPYMTEEDFEVASRLSRYFKGFHQQLLFPCSRTGYPTQGANVRACVFLWDQEMNMWYKRIAADMEVCVVGVDKYKPETDSGKVHQSKIRNARARSNVMKRIWRHKQALTSTQNTDTITK